MTKTVSNPEFSSLEMDDKSESESESSKSLEEVTPRQQQGKFMSLQEYQVFQLKQLQIEQKMKREL